MSGIAVVSPRLPGGPGGVADHTARLVASWSDADRPVTVLERTDGDPTAVAEEWREEGVTAVLIQYVPFLYARRGLSRFPRAIARASRQRGMRVTVFVHETWVPRTRVPWLLLSPLQRRQLRALIAVVDEVVTAVPAWRRLLSPGAKVVYVGATLAGPPEAPADPPLAAPLVFSPFAAGLNWDWIAAAARAIAATPHLVVAGADAGDGRVPRDLACQWTGRLETRPALRLFARAPLALAPFTDGLTGRRTSALALLGAGARTISSRGPLSDPVFDGSPVALASSRDEFAALAQAAWARARREGVATGRGDRLAWYREHFDPAVLDARLLDLVAGTR